MAVRVGIDWPNLKVAYFPREAGFGSLRKFPRVSALCQNLAIGFSSEKLLIGCEAMMS